MKFIYDNVNRTTGKKTENYKTIIVQDEKEDYGFFGTVQLFKEFTT